MNDIKIKLAFEGASQAASEAARVAQATKAMQDQIQKLTLEMQAGTKGSQAYFETLARAKGVDSRALQPYLDQLRQAKQLQAEAATGAGKLGDSFNLVRAGVAGVVGSQLVRWAKDAGGALFDASVNAERLRTMLNFATGGNSTREIAYLRDITQKLGLEMQSTAASYGQFQAAAKGTTLEGSKARDVFESVAKASAVMGLSADQTSGVLLALQQMVSKGTVQAEELRGQLGERLPGAFQVAARAMGVSTGELGKMLEQGQIVADDFLPRFATALNDYIGDAADAAANRLEASTTKMGNAWDRLMQAVGDSGVSAQMAEMATTAAGSLDAIAVGMEAARARGAGLWGQLGAGIGVMYDLLDYWDRYKHNLYANEQAMAKAQARLAELQAQANKNAAVKFEISQLEQFINRLGVARTELQRLRAEASGVANVGGAPRDIREDNQGLTRGASYARWAKEQADAEKGLMEVRMKSAGVNKAYFDDLGKWQAALRAGVISEKEYTEQVSRLATETWKASAAGKAATEAKRAGSKAANEAAKAAEREANAFKSFMTSLREKVAGQELELRGGEKLSKADRERLELQKLLERGTFKLTAARQAEAEATIRALDLAEKEVEAIKVATKAAEERQALRIKETDSITTFIRAQQEAHATELKSVRDRIRDINDEQAAMATSIKLNISLAEAVQRVAIARLREKQQGFWEGSEGWLQLQQQIDAHDELLEKIAGQEAMKKSNDFWDSFMSAAKGSFTNIEQGWSGTVKQLWKSIKTGLLDMLWNAFARPIMLNLRASLMGTGGLLGGGTAMAGQGGGGILGSFGSSPIGSLLSSVTGFGGSLSAGLGYGLSGVFANGFGSMFSAGAQMLSAGSIGGGIGTMLGAAAPVLLPLAALFASGAFSRKHAQHNLEGTFGGATGFEGNWHDYYKGGLFRSSKTVNTDLDSTTLNALRAAWKAQEAAITDYAKVLGLSTENIEGFTYRINLKLKDLGDPSDAGYMDKVWQMVNEAIVSGSNEMAERILGTWTTTTREVEETIKTGFWDDETFTTVKKTVEETTYVASEYAREGERAIDTLTRLATSLQATNAAFDMLGLSLYEASLAGGDMASKLIDQMGGMDAFGAQVGAYWQNYYTEAERHAYMTAQMTEALAAAGLEMPTTVAAFRALVDAQDLTTDAGRAAFTALMSVNAAFTEVYGNADAAAGSIADLGDELAAMEPIVFGAASDLASVIEQGLLGTLTGAQLGEQMADVVMQGMYSAIAGGFSQQITALMVEGVLNPMIAAAMTGASMSAAVSQAAIDRVIQHAQAAAAAINAVLSDPGFQAAIQQVQAAVGSINAAFTEVYGNADAAAGSIADLGDELAAMEPIVFGAASDLASVIEQGLLGTLTGAQLGEQMADVVMQGMYSAIAGGFSQQITALMVEGVLNPMIAAAMTGASMSAAVSQAAIDRVIQHAQAAAAAINAVLSDPGFQAAVQQVQAAVGSISVGIQRPEPIYDSYAAQHARELAAQREAERLASEAQRAADQRAREAERLASEAQRAADQRAREAQQLAEQQAREAQRLADEEARYWQAVYSERQGLLKQLWTLEGNVAAVRQMELEALDPSNRALQTRIWQLQDEKEAVDRYNAALKNAQEFLGGFTRNIQEFIFKVSHAQADAAEGYQLAAAKFSAQMVLARGGDRDALNNITGYADTLIESIRRESTTGAEANLRIARVLGQLGELPQQVSAEQLIVDAIASGTSTTVNALSNLQSSLINELIGGFDQLDTTMDGKLSFSELQTALAGKATDAEIAALIARVDTNSDGQISKLEAVRAAAATTATNVGTVNTSVGTVNTSVGTWGSNQYTRLGTVDSSVAFWGNAQTNATNAILNYQSVQTAGTYADFRADYRNIRESVDDVYDAIRAMHFTDGINSIARMRAQVDEVRNNSYPLYVKSEHRAGTMMTFETGGYTGHGGRFEPAGIVHRGEGVLNQDDIRALGGPAGFEALRRSLKRGYADGGLVAPVPFVAPILRQGSDPEIKRLLRELVDEARAKESNDRVRHSTMLNQVSRQTEIMERQETIGMPRQRKENAVVV